MEELTRRDELIRAITAIELDSLAVDSEISSGAYNRLPLSRLTALGVGLEPFAAAVQNIVNGGTGLSGYYKVTLPPGTHLAQFTNNTDFLGTALSNMSNTIQGQAHLTPLLCNPTMLFVAATLFSIDQKLSAIQQTQQELLDFLLQKEKSAMKGDLDFLIDVFNHYKYNWNDEKFKSANHLKAMDIRQTAGQKVDLYREQIKRHLGKRSLLHSDQEVKKQLTKVQDEFQDYQSALYLYGFSYFLEVLLQGNFEAAYLDDISAKLDRMSVQYRELYSAAYTQIESRSKSSLQAKVLSRVATANKVAGETIAKIPVVSKSLLDESLIAVGEKLNAYEESRTSMSLRQLVDYQSSGIRPFIDQINAINRMYNNPMTLIFNGKTLYIGCALNS